jgi:hypothetical protein
MTLLPRRPEGPDVLTIPTPPLQRAAIFVIFFFTALGFITFSLRAYIRLRTRQWGLDDYLVTAAMIFSLMMIGPFYMCKSQVPGMLLKECQLTHRPPLCRHQAHVLRLAREGCAAL